MSTTTTGNENLPLLLGLAVVAIILFAFFSSRGGDEESKASKAAPKAAPAAATTASKKSKKKKAKSKAKAAPAPAAKKAEAKEEPAPVPEPEEEPEAKPAAAKKKKKKAKKKTGSGGNAAAKEAAPAPAAEKKSVAFAGDDDSDEDDDDDVELWRIQSAANRSKGSSDAAKRAAANKERDRVRALKRKEEKAKAEARKAAEAKAAEEEAAVREAEAKAAAEAAMAEAAKKAQAEAKKKNGASVTTNGGTEAAPAAAAGEKKKRKRKKKKGGAAAEESRPPLVTPAAPATPAVEHWETVPKVEEWQEVGTKRTKQKAKLASTAAGKEEEAFLSDEPAVEEPGETSATMSAGDDPFIFIGKGGSTIQNLQEVTGAKFHLNRTTNVLTISGSDEAVQLGLAEAKTILALEAERKANEATERVTWGSDAIKAVIGRGGANIRATQEATGVKIDANVEEGTLVIVGPADNVATALTMCHNAAYGECQETMELGSRNAVNLVFGDGFSMIRSLQDATGCKLDIARGTTQLKLAGSAEAVASASAKVTALLEANRGIEMTIDNSKVGAVYGKGGETLRTIQERTGTQIDVARGPTHATVSVMGTADAAARARNMLQRAIDGEVEVQPGEVAEEVALGSATAAVVGRGGSKVKELEAKHGVKINVRSELQKARVVGKPEKVEAAVKDIEAIAKPIIDAENAQKVADEAIESGESAWQVEPAADDAEGW